MKKKIKTTSLDQMIDHHVGKQGSLERTEFDMELSVELLACKMKELRNKQKLTQGQLSKMVGVKQAQISKIENMQSATMQLSTILKVFTALGSSLRFRVVNEEISEDQDFAKEFELAH